MTEAPNKPHAQSRRRDEIEEAAQALLARDGYGGTTMSAVARQAGASMQTLYGWYGDKTGLFCALVDRNARTLNETAMKALDGRAPLDGLHRLGVLLVTLLTGPLAVALARAAASDASGTLGHALAESGRDRVKPQVARLMTQLHQDGVLRAPDADEAAETWLGLLLGDLQIRCVAGHLRAPDQAEATRRSEQALARLRLIYAPS